jgi:hypothetical protein
MMASEKTRAERVAICMDCPFLKKGLMFRCTDCGCPIRTKTALASSSCPQGKWHAEKPAQQRPADA